MYRIPKDVRPIDSQTIDTYIPSRAQEKGGRHLKLQRGGREFTGR